MMWLMWNGSYLANFVRQDSTFFHVNVFSRHLTGTIQALRAYFQDYKRTTTGLVNQFAFEDAAVPPGALGRVRAVSAVRESHRQWSAAFGK
jgi:hypothetical protein